MNKDKLRKEMLNKRKKIIDKEELSKAIINQITNLDIYKKSKLIALYKSLNNEVDTNTLIDKALKEKIVLLPRIDNRKIVFVKINKSTNYVKSNFGVLEPIGDSCDDDIDLIIVPGLAFDKDLNRLGFGRGYYDKYLSNKNIYKIGLAFDEQIVDEVPHDKLDIRMDMVITNKKTYTK